MFPELARDDVFRLETRRLWLRWPRESDAPALTALADGWDVSRMTANVPHPHDIGEAGRFILAARAANARGAAMRLALTLKTFPRKFVGVVAVEPDEPAAECNGARARLDFWLGRVYSGEGLMSEAVEAVEDAFFRVTRGDELAALVPPDNDASRAVLEKAGFVEDAGPGDRADCPITRLVLRRRDWQEPARPALRAGFASDRALS